MVALVVVLVLFIGGAVAVGFALHWAGSKVNDTVDNAIGAGTGGPCPYVSNADATEALGTDATATYYSGVFTFMNITDARVLADQPSCVMTETASTTQGMPGLGRAVKYAGGDAAGRYQQELTKAKGVTEEKGNGLSVSTESYFNKDVPGLGDEAFCTTSSGTLAGVLARKGDTLVYVAVTRAGETPGLNLDDPSNPKMSTDDAACDASVTLARKILG
jgi:hypothetical protein